MLSPRQSQSNKLFPEAYVIDIYSLYSIFCIAYQIYKILSEFKTYFIVCGPFILINNCVTKYKILEWLV